MNRYAIIRNGIVENIIVWDGVTPYNPQGVQIVLLAAEIECDINYTYEDGIFTAPIPEESPPAE